MAIYTFEYINNKGETKTVEKSFKMSEMPEFIPVAEGGATYKAIRIMSVTADLKRAWNYDVNTSDLPPVDYVPPGAQNG